MIVSAKTNIIVQKFLSVFPMISLNTLSETTGSKAINIFSFWCPLLIFFFYQKCITVSCPFPYTLLRTFGVLCDFWKSNMKKRHFFVSLCIYLINCDIKGVFFFLNQLLNSYVSSVNYLFMSFTYDLGVMTFSICKSSLLNRVINSLYMTAHFGPSL